jgi:hypothetical protein
MRRQLALMASWALMVALVGCTTGDCAYTVHVGSPDADVTYTDQNGNVYAAKTDSNGNVAVPCGTENTVEESKFIPEYNVV